MMRLRSPLSIVMAAALLVLAGCGGSSDGAGDGGDSSAATQEAATPQRLADGDTIGMKNLKFLPENVIVTVGQKVTWENLESIPHDAVADNGEFKSEIFGKGKTFSWTPTKAGRVPYVCTLHPGMDGVITVEKK